MKTRLEGYYWVKWHSLWVLAEWADNAWYLCGDPHAFNDNDFEEFGELLIAPKA